MGIILGSARTLPWSRMSKNKNFSVMLAVFGFLGLSFAQADFTYEAKGKRDPFIPLVGKDGRLIKLDKEEDNAKSDLIVDGIIYDKQGVSYALANGRVVGVGDYMNGYRVLKIEKDKVIFLKGDSIQEVAMHKGEEN